MLSLSDRIWIKVKSAYRRITLNRLTAAFFLFSFVHCFAQGIIQSFLFTVDSDYSALISTIVKEAQVPQKEFAWLTRHHGNFTLRLCNHIPGGQSQHPCEVIFQTGGVDVVNVPADYRRSEPEAIPAQSLIGSPVNQVTSPGQSFARGGGDGTVDISLDGWKTVKQLSKQCTRILVYPDQVLKNAKRENIAFIAAQFWLFIISYIAIMYDSIPHTLAVLCARVLVTGWSAYEIWRTLDIEKRFEHLFIGPDSPCNINLYPAYFRTRIAYEIPDLFLNTTALVISGYIGWQLVKAYQRETFRCLGPPKAIVRIYKFFMAVLVCLQLAVFVLVVAMGLWIDQLVNGAIAKISSHTPIYQALFISTTILLLPWIAMGWYAIRHEMKRLMAAFLGIAFVFISGWAIMFYSLVYRWTFVQWPLLACFTVESFIVLIGSMVFGIVCWLNFGKGLSHYLVVEDKLASSDFEPELFSHDLEKGVHINGTMAPPTFLVSFSGNQDELLDVDKKTAAF